MKIQLNQFGKLLMSHPAGKKAWLAFEPTINNIPKNEEIFVDFKGVAVLAPSWAEEFITPLQDRFNKQVKLLNTDNASVTATLAILPKH